MSKSKIGTIAALVSTVILIVLFQNATVYVPPALVIYMATDGDDANRGVDAGHAIKTLARAQVLVQTEFAKGPRPIEVRIRPGVYFGESLKWTEFSPFKISFIGEGPSLDAAPAADAERVIFDGRTMATESIGRAISFLNFGDSSISTAAPPRNIVIDNITVQNYLEGITFSTPDRNNPARAGGGHVIRNSTFRRIGNKYSTPLGADGKPLLDNIGRNRPGLAVIRPVNTHNSHFINNRFEDIENFNSTGGQHPYYFAHYSSGNRIEGNRFVNIRSGTAIKFRDYSNSNVIEKNEFDNVLRAAIEVWHCEGMQPMPDGNPRGYTKVVGNNGQITNTGRSIACSKGIPYRTSSGVIAYEPRECPSWDNIARDNLFLNTAEPTSVFALPGPVTSNCDSNRFPAIGSMLSLQSINELQTGHLVRTLIGTNEKFGICTNRDDCVGQTKCYLNDTGSQHLHCSLGNEWRTCATDNVGSVAGTHACMPAGTLDVGWSKIPEGKFLVKTQKGQELQYGFCSRATDCFNPDNSINPCWMDDTGSMHLHCAAQKWSMCNKSVVGTKSGSKTCLYDLKKADYVWM